MKEHADKAVSHKTKVLGKTVPTLLLIGLFLAGTGTAAVLTSFGEVSGTADVEQSVLVDGDALDTESEAVTLFDATGDDALVAGSSVTGENISIENQAEYPVDVDFTTSAESYDFDSDEGITYNYTLLNTYAEASNNETVKDNNASVEVVRNNGSFAVKATSEIEKVAPDDGDTKAVAGVFFDVSYHQSDPLEDTSATVEYTVPETEGDNEAETDAPDWFWVTFEDDSGEELTAIASAIEADSGEQVALSDYENGDASNIPVFDSEDNPVGTVDQFEDVHVVRIGFTTGSARSADEGDRFELIYDEVEFEDTKLIEDNTFVNDGDAQEDREASLKPETEYTFASHLDTSVYLQPDEGYEVDTELQTGH